MAGERQNRADSSIVVRPRGNGTSVSIVAPPGFGTWHLTFPENMLLEGPGRGRTKATWQTEPDGAVAVRGKMDGDFAHSILIQYKPSADVIDLRLEVLNLSAKKWEYGGEAMACLRPIKSPAFVGEVGKRTLVRFGGSFQTVAALGERFGRRVGTKTTVSCMVKGEDMAPYQAKRHDPRMTMDNGIILRHSPDGTKLVAFAWDRTHRVSMNFTYSCMHSNPRVTGLAPGEKVVRVGKIYFLHSTVEEFCQRYARDSR